MDLEIYKNQQDLINALAKVICEASKESISNRGEFNFVLSGGSSPQKLYELLASKTYKDKIDWQKTYFFFGDERFVPENDSQRNSLMAKKTLFAPLHIPASNIFYVDTSGSPKQAAKLYAEAISSHFKNKSIHFDFVLLGLGGNAHTASLFPFTSVLKEREATIKSVFVEELQMDRITMTAPLINQSKNIAFLAFGENKAEAVHHVLQDEQASEEEYPAKLIHPKKGELYWFLDTEASSLLKPEEKNN